jgi:hypothetical protein
MYNRHSNSDETEGRIECGGEEREREMWERKREKEEDTF